MRFDMTQGKSPRYMVSVYGWDIEDKYYFHYLADAKALIEKLRKKLRKGTALSLWDMDKDVRKMFAKEEREQ